MLLTQLTSSISLLATLILVLVQPNEAVKSGVRRGKYNSGNHLVVTDVTRVGESGIFSKVTEAGYQTQNVYTVENSTNGELYSFGTLSTGYETSCYFARVSSKRGLAGSLLDYTKKHKFGNKNCNAYGASIDRDGYAMFVVGKNENGPFLLKASNHFKNLDWALVTISNKALLSLCPQDEIISGSIAYDNQRSVVYVSFNFKVSNAHIWKYDLHTKKFSQFAILPSGYVISKNKGIFVTAEGNLVVSGANTQDVYGNPLQFTHAFVLQLEKSTANVITSSHITPMIDNHQQSAVVVRTSYEPTHGHVYVSISTKLGKSAIHKLIHFTRHRSPNHGGKGIIVQGIATDITVVPDRSIYVAVYTPVCPSIVAIDPQFKKAHATQVTPETLGNYGTKVTILASAYNVGTLAVSGIINSSKSSSTFPVVSNIGSGRNRVLIFHRVTRQALTMAHDGTVHLFPYESLPGSASNPPTLNQQWDLVGEKAIRNAATGLALTISGHPNPVPGYDQENGHNVIGTPYRMAATQRWIFNSDRTISNLLDTRCLGLDREYLRENRFPGKAGRHQNTTWQHLTGVPAVTVYCLVDRIIQWEVIPVV